MSKNNGSQSSTTRRVVFVAGPGTEILDLVGPLQVFSRASDMHCREHPGAHPIYSIEVVSISSSRALTANCGLDFSTHKTFRDLLGTSNLEGNVSEREKTCFCRKILRIRGGSIYIQNPQHASN